MRLQVRTRPHRQVSTGRSHGLLKASPERRPANLGTSASSVEPRSRIIRARDPPPPQLRTDPVFTRTLVRVAEAEVLVLAYVWHTMRTRVKIQHPLPVLLTASMH